MKTLLMLPALLTLGCTSAHDAPTTDAAAEGDGGLAVEAAGATMAGASIVAPAMVATSAIPAPARCPAGWTYEAPDQCARWRTTAPIPARCEREFPSVGQGLHGGSLLVCGEVGYVYDTSHDRWHETDFWPEAPDTWSASLPPPESPTDQRLSAPLWGGHGLLVLTFAPYAVPWTATRWDPVTEIFVDTLDPPEDLQPAVAFTNGLGQVLAVGLRTTLYEITEAQ